MIKIDVHTPQGTHYVASFPATDAGEAQAIAFIENRPDHTCREAEGNADLIASPRLMELLYPLCHHGMALDLCMDPYGPHHFGTYEQERQAAGY
jgi:hypothetical protein